MPELIDRQKVLEIAMSYCPDDDGCCSKAGHDIREMLDEIEALPTIEPGVRRGRWKKKNGVIYCTNCKKSRWSESFELMLRGFDFCPKCGARMDATDTNVGVKGGETE